MGLRRRLFRPSSLYSISVIVLSLSSLVENIAYGLPLSYFPNYAVSLGAPYAYIGFFTAAFMATSALLSSRFGSLSDRIGRKKLIQAGLLADVFLGTLTGLIGNWIILLLIRALNGVATAAVRPPAEASLIDQVPSERKGEAMGFYLTMSMIGWFIGPLFGGVIQFFSERGLGLRLEDSYRIPFFVDSILALIALALVAWKVEETRGEKIRQMNNVKEEVKLSSKVSFSLKILYVTSVTMGFAVGFIQPVGVFFFDDLFQADPLQIGAIMSISGFAGILCNFYAGRMADKIGRKPIIALGSLSSRLASIVLPFTNNLIQATGVMVFRSMGINVAMPADRALRADLVPAKIRGKLFGRLQAFFNLGMIIGPILGTWLYVLYRYQVFKLTWPTNMVVRGAGVPFFLSAILGLTALTLLLVFVEEPARCVAPNRET